MYDNSETKRVLASMLKENTGMSILDSGSVYGRNWQQNQTRDFDSEPASIFRAHYGLMFTHNVYHWLLERVTYDKTMDNLFSEFCEETDSDAWGSELTDFADWLKGRGVKVGGIYGEDDPFVVNTYNGEDMLSQILLYLYFEVTDAGESGIEETAYLLLQIHGGCDARGGYTSPRAFQITGDGDGTDIFDNARGTVYCDHCHTWWNTEDGGYSFDDRGSNEIDYQEWDDLIPDLGKLTLIGDDNDRNDPVVWWLDREWNMDHKIDYAKHERLFGEVDFLFALPSGEIVCPHCGEGILQGSSR